MTYADLFALARLRILTDAQADDADIDAAIRAKLSDAAVLLADAEALADAQVGDTLTDAQQTELTHARQAWSLNAQQINKETVAARFADGRARREQRARSRANERTR